MRRSLIAAAVTLGMSMTAPTVTMASPGYAAGLSTGCKICSGASKTAFGVIRTALFSSEQAIGRAINDGPYLTPAPIGFPALQSQINASSADQSEKIVSAIGDVTNELISVLNQQPAIRVAVKEDAKAPPLPELQQAADSHGGCQALAYGSVMDREPRSSLGWGYQYVTAGKFEQDGDKPIGESVMTPIVPPSDIEGLEAGLTNVKNRANQTTNRQFQEMIQKAEAAGTDEARVGQILDPSILYRQDKRTFSVEPDELGMSDDERADYLIQYLVADSPTYADALAASATTPAQLGEAVDGQIANMEFAMVMAALNEQIELRRPRSGTTGPDAFLARAMGEEAPEVSSRDDFWYRLSHYRQRDTAWLSRTMIDQNYALSQQLQIEIEYLAQMYERLKTKRSNVLVLAQIAANFVENEND